jgi:hypothetical protein
MWVAQERFQGQRSSFDPIAGGEKRTRPIDVPLREAEARAYNRGFIVGARPAEFARLEFVDRERAQGFEIAPPFAES